MDRIKSDLSRFGCPKGRARTAAEDIIEQIVEATFPRNPQEHRNLARRLAIAAKALKWTTTDLHALLQKRHDPHLRSYGAFVSWSCKIKGKAISSEVRDV